MPLIITNTGTGVGRWDAQVSGASSSGYSTLYIPDFTFWEDTGVNAPVSQGAVVRVADKLYMFGGTNSSNTNVATIFTTNYAENPTFSDSGYSLPGAGNGFRVGIVNEKLYTFGDCVGSVDIYSASLSNPLNWGDSMTDLPQRRDDAPLVIANDNILIFRGYTGSGNLSTIAVASVNTPLIFGTNAGDGYSYTADGAYTSGNRIIYGGGTGTGGRMSFSTFASLSFTSLNSALPTDGGMPTFFNNGNQIFLWGSNASNPTVYVQNVYHEFANNNAKFRSLGNILPVTNRFNRSANWVGPDGRYYFVNSDYTSRRIYRSGRKPVLVMNEMINSYPPYAGLPGTLPDGTFAMVSSQVRVGFESWRTNRTGSF